MVMLALEGFREEAEKELGLSTAFPSDLHNEHSPRLNLTSPCRPWLLLEQEASCLVLCEPHDCGIVCAGFSRKERILKKLTQSAV